MPPLSQPKNASRSLLTILAVIVFVTAMVLVILQNMGPAGGSGKLIRGYEDGYADGFRDARAQSGAPALKESSILSGKVTSVEASSVTFNTEGLVLNERVDGVSNTRTANVTSETKIVLVENLPSEETEAAQKSFQRAMANLKAGDTPPTPPSSFKETAILLSDIKEGDTISVQAAPDENILPLSSFNVVKISVRHPSAPPVPPASDTGTQPSTPPAVAPTN